jgi:hypothetical protein
MRFEVPQFIEIEDKIFGPFTWKQFVYLGGGVGLAVVLFFVAPFFVTFLVGIPIALLASALAFYPVNSRPFSVLLESMWNFYKNNRTYYWRRQRDIVYKGEENINLTGVTTYTSANLPVGGDSGLTSLAHKLELNVLGNQRGDTKQQ